MRRVFMLLTVAMAAMMAIGAGTAFAQTTTTGPVCNTVGKGKDAVTTCVTTTTTKTTSTETNKVAGPPIVIDLDNTSVETPAVVPCEVGNSGRVGTAEGTSTQEFENISTQQTEVTVTRTFETTTTTTTTEVTTGQGSNRRTTTTSATSPPVTTLTGTTTSDPMAVGEAALASTPIGDPVFTATGKCKNVPGPQPQARG